MSSQTGDFSATNSQNLLLRTASTDRLIVLNSNGNVGIATAAGSISEKLYVTGSILATQSLWANGGNMGTSTATNLSLRTNNTERILVLNSNGNVGIATASGSITEKLTVTGNILSTGNLLSNGNVQSTGGLYTVNHASNNYTLRLNATDRFTVLNSNGNVGIGTSSPLKDFHCQEVISFLMMPLQLYTPELYRPTSRDILS